MLHPDVVATLDIMLLPGHRPDMPAPMPQVGDPNWGAKYDPGFFVDGKSNSVPMPQVGDPNWGQLPF